jgi:uroporphyrinogen decarboxylase
MKSMFLDALNGTNNSGKAPIWLMRQAGRYMESYRTLRQKHTFLGMCKNPELIAQVTELPITSFGFDAAIVFSDILLITEAFGFTVRFEEGEGPILEPALQSPEDVEKLVVDDIEQRLSYVFEGVRLLKKQLQVPLLGFAGAPFTIASYMIEGKSSKDLKKTKEWMYKQPKSFQKLLDLIGDAVAIYLNKLIDQGVDAIQIFDSWAQVLAYPQFEEFSLFPMQRVMKQLKPCPIILFCRGSSYFFDGLASIKPQGISLDWQCDLAEVRKKVASNITLQGNLDPHVLFADEKVVKKEAKAILDKMGKDPAFIFNLGHGVLPHTPEDNVKALVECVKSFA